MIGVSLPHPLIALAILALFAGRLQGLPAADAQKDVRWVLSSRWAEDERTAGTVARELAGIGSEAIPILVGLIDGTALPGVLGLTEEEGEELELGDWWRGPDEFGPVAFEALGHLPAKDVIGYLDEYADESAPLENRLIATRILGRLGSAEGLELLCELSSTFDDFELQYRSVRTPFEGAFASILTEDRRSIAELEDRLHDLQYDVQTIVVDAVTSSECPESLRLLETLLEGEYGADQRVLGAIADLGDRFRWRLRDEPAELLQLYLYDDDPELRRAAVAGLERLQAATSCRLLINLLQDESPAVQRTSHWALKRLSGVPLDEQPELWHAWLDEQEAWWRFEDDRLTGQLDSGEPAQVLAALRALSERPFFRHRIASLLADTMSRTGPEVNLVLSDTLRRLGSRAAVPGLVRQLYDSNEAVQQAAWKALRELTEQDLPLDARRWSDYVNG